jgi:alpha-tubulin suppressor-like RCC1 family protein
MCVWAAVSFVIVLLAGDGRVFTWGHNTDGHLGLGDKVNHLTPTAASLPDEEAVEELHCGNDYFFARVGVCVCVRVCVSLV